MKRAYNPIQKDYVTLLKTIKDTNGECIAEDVEHAPMGGVRNQYFLKNNLITRLSRPLRIPNPNYYLRTMSENGHITSSIENGIGSVTFYHPQSNSMPGDLLRKLAEEITAMGKKPEAKVIVLRSEGDKSFCAGASFDELISIKDLATGENFFSGFALVINAMRTAPKFVIARVQGKAVGGGVGLASAADYTLAADGASVKLSELAVGIGPFVVGPAVERKIGTSAFTNLAINATEWRDANWAKEKGLYADVYPTVELLDEGVNALAKKLSTSNPDAMAELKKIAWAGTEHWDKLLFERAAISGRLVLSEFTVNAINAFKKK